MEPPVASPTATKPVLRRKSLRLGACAFIGFLSHEARSLIRNQSAIDAAMIGRAPNTLRPPLRDLKANPILNGLNAHKAAVLTYLPQGEPGSSGNGPPPRSAQLRCGDKYCIQKYYLCRAAPRARDISVGGRAANDAE